MSEIPNYDEQPLLKPEVLDVPGDPIEYLASQPDSERWVRPDEVVQEYDTNAQLVSYSKLPETYHTMSPYWKKDAHQDSYYEKFPLEKHELQVNGFRVDVTQQVKQAVETPVIEQPVEDMDVQSIERDLPSVELENPTEAEAVMLNTLTNLDTSYSELRHLIGAVKDKIKLQEKFGHKTKAEKFEKRLKTLQEQFSLLEKSLHDTEDIAVQSFPRVLEVRANRKQDRDALLQHKIDVAVRTAAANAKHAAELKAGDVRVTKLGSLIAASEAGVTVTKDEKSGLKLIDGEEWAGITKLADVYQEGDEHKHMIVQKPTWETEHLYENEILYEVGDGEEWRTLSSYAYGNRYVEPGTKLRLSVWQVALGEDGLSFVLKNDRGEEQQLDALQVRKAVKYNSMLRKIIVNSDHPQEIILGSTESGQTVFDGKELSNLVEGEILNRNSDWKHYKEQPIEDPGDLPPRWRDSGIMQERYDKLVEIKDMYPGSKITMIKMNRDKTTKYNSEGDKVNGNWYLALQMPAGLDADGKEMYDALCESPEYGNAAYYVSHEKGDWRPIVVDVSKAHAIAHGAIPIDHRNDPGKNWQTWWNEVIVGLRSGDPDMLAMLARRIGSRIPADKYYAQVAAS